MEERRNSRPPSDRPSTPRSPSSRPGSSRPSSSSSDRKPTGPNSQRRREDLPARGGSTSRPGAPRQTRDGSDPRGIGSSIASQGWSSADRPQQNLRELFESNGFNALNCDYIAQPTWLDRTIAKKSGL